MPTELAIHTVNRGGMIVTAGDGRHTVTMDYPMPGAESEDLAGLTPLRMLLASLAARGLRRDEHPTVITEIALEFTAHGAGVESAAVEKALAISEEQMCPVWAMLKDGTPIIATYCVVEE
jgi:uncharacterized OsmC-like protein